MKKLIYSGIVAVALLIAGCGTGQNGKNTDSSVSDSVASVDSLPDFGPIYNKLLSQLPDMEFPTWIYVDSINAGLISVSHLNAAVLFPEGFGLPDDVDLFVFAKQNIDSAYYVLWYKMQLQGSENSDVWMVMYDTDGPLEAHLVATKGVGEGYAKFFSPINWREVLVDKQDKIMVTTRQMAIMKGKFVKSNEEYNKYGPGSTAGKESQAKIDEFLK